MAFARPILVLALVIASNVTPSGADTTTCSAGLRLYECRDSGVPTCVTPCNTTAEFKQNPCTPADVCYPCVQSKWCDGLTSNECPRAMASPQGSTTEGNCTCHRGHTQDGLTCTVCPTGSWCDGDGEHSCPDGMTSNLASVAEEDCYCPEDYTGDFDGCDGRENVPHHRCNAGYGNLGETTASSDAPSYSDCSVGSSNFWCDGTACSGCPTEDQGVSYEYGKTSFAECFCPFGYTTLVDQGPCIPCPPDGVQNASAQLWTRGVNCAVTNMSVVSFTATLAVSVDEFNAQRGEFAMGVAQALWVPFMSVAVGEAWEGGGAAAAGQRRRLLASTNITVASTVTIPSADAAFVAAAATPANLDRALAARGMAVSAVSTPQVAQVEDTPAETTSVLVITVAVSGTCLLVLGALVWWWCCRPDSGATSEPAYDKIRQDRQQRGSV